MSRPTPIKEEDFREAQDSDLGWCPECEDFTVEGCEPDARGRKCHACGGRSGVGAEQALIEGLISF